MTRKYERKPLDFEDIEGKIVKDTDQEELGKVKSLQVDPESLRVEGIVVDQGLLNKDVIIGREYVEKIGRKYVWLNIDLTLLIKGKTVIDRQGKEIGKVIEVDRIKKSNDMRGIKVKTEGGEVYYNCTKIKDINGEKVYLF